MKINWGVSSWRLAPSIGIVARFCGLAAATWVVGTGLSWSAVHVIHVGNDRFAICDGQAGIALGLCHGGVAADCGGTAAGSNACLGIEDKFRQMTGYEAPWIYQHYPIQRVTVGVFDDLDLETGQTCTSTPVMPPFQECNYELRQQVDLHTMFDGSTPPAYLNPFRIMTGGCPEGTEGPRAGQLVRFAFLDGIQFNQVTTANIATATFETDTDGDGGMIGSIWPVFDANDTVIVHTCADNYFKVGWFTCNVLDSPWTQCSDTGLPNMSYAVSYQMLQPAR